MKPKEKADQNGRVLLRLLVFAACLAIPLLLPGASGPAWWTNQGVLNGNTPNDYAIVNQGQAKTMAVSAVNELNENLSQFGGAGDTLNALALTLSATSSRTNDYLALNLGQYKSLIQPFYDRLLSLGYRDAPLTSGTYPWVTSGLTPNDYAAGNIGQLKYLFSFDVTVAGTNGIPFWWEEKYYGTNNGQPPALDPNAFVAWSGSQVTILQAYQNGWNPIDYYSGQPPSLTIVSPNPQTGPPNGYLPSPLIVAVTDSNGNILTGAPVNFQVTSGAAYLQAPGVAAGAASAMIVNLTARTTMIIIGTPRYGTGQRLSI